MSDDEGSRRADLWLWHARFFKTRAMAGRFVEEGRIRLTRAGAESRVDKPSRGLRVGDVLVFAIGGRIINIRVVGFGERRGPASEARTLYAIVEA